MLASWAVKQRLLLRGGLDHVDRRDRAVLMHHVRGYRPVDELLARLAQGVRGEGRHRQRGRYT